jgi:hypothetical protein
MNILRFVSKFGLYSDKGMTITFESHLDGLRDDMKELLLELRRSVKSLGENVIEEVRPHRIVYAKTLTFRTFLDVQPRSDSIVISIKKGRNEPEATHTVKTQQELEAVTQQIADAYNYIK